MFDEAPCTTDSPVSVVWICVPACLTAVCVYLSQFEGTPFYPSGDRMWQVIDKYSVTKFYTAPTAIRALMRLGDEVVKR